MSEPVQKSIRVAVADKNPLIQAALKQLLSEDRRFELVHVASDCATFLRNVERQPVDVGVIGWIFGSCDGRYILDHLAGEDHAARIVVYTGDASQTVIGRVGDKSHALTLLRVCREGEAWPLAAGLHLGGQSPLVIMQVTGLFESGDALRNVLFDLKLPIFAILRSDLKTSASHPYGPVDITGHPAATRKLP